MKNFELVGILSPGTINLPGRGTFDLEKIDDASAELLYKEGLKYLKPTVEFRKVLFPHEKPIETTSLEVPVKPIKTPKKK